MILQQYSLVYLNESLSFVIRLDSPSILYTISTRWCGCNRTRCVGVSLACCITSPRIQQTKFGRIRSSRWDLFWNNCLFARNGVATLAVST